MPRSTTPTFRCQALDQLTRELLFAPPARRVEQVRRAERLHDQIEPEINYPLEFVVYRITGYRSEIEQETLLVGQAILHDLRLLIDRLSQSMDIPVGADEVVESGEALARRLNVSTKTLSRWRQLGLRWRWARVDGGRKGVVYPRRASERFLAAHPQLLRRAADFTRLDAVTHRQILQRARRIAQSSQVSPNQVAIHLSRKYGRALETIRRLLEAHDHRHPEDRIFADRSGPLDGAQRQAIAQAHAAGTPIRALAAQYRRTRSTIQRAIHLQRAAAVRKLDIQYFALPPFTRDDADSVYLRPESEGHHAAVQSMVPVHDLPEAIQPLYHQPMLSADELESLLVRMNYLKFKGATLRAGLSRTEPRVGDLDQIERCLEQSSRLRNRIAAACLPLVLIAARRHLVGPTQGATRRLIELLERGNGVLYDAIDSFDPGSRKTFESLLNFSLMRQFASQPHGAPAGAAKASRKNPASRTLERLLNQAGESGIDLHVEDEMA
ncbi:MAG: hypothetical protein WD042_16195 [Phycisphaeraceae bacterium]